MTPSRPPIVRLTGRAAFVACSLLLLLFAVLSFSATSTKCSTYDETLHVPAAYAQLRYGDFRANPEHPPLWKYWAALPCVVRPPADPNVAGPEFAAVLRQPAAKWDWAQHTLFGTPGNDPVRLVGQSRFMMLLVGVACGALLSAWAHRLAGPLAAVVACTLYSLDPNFLAHASLVTNDVAFTLAFVAATWALWRVGRAATVGSVAGLALACGLAVGIKFSGILLAPILVLVLGIRAMLPEPWPTPCGPIASRPRRVAAAAVICLVAGVVTYASIWASYGFQPGFAPDPAAHPSYEDKVRGTTVSEILGRTGQPPTEQQVRAWRPAAFIRVAAWALNHHAVPAPFAYGLLTVYATTSYHPSYLLGQITGRGHWYYFPFAILVKTPLATLSACVAAVGVLLISRRTRASAAAEPAADRWLWTCLAVPTAVFLASAMTSHLNIGLRHVFPVYPALFLAAGVAAARLDARHPRALRSALAILAVGLAAETLPAYPNYIPFFNAAAGGYRGGIHLLGDSNLDWGQDLPLVADWQRAHPGRTLYLAYFGTADPAYYGIRYVPLTLGNDVRITRRVLPTTGVVAASANMLQQDWPRREAQEFFSALRGRTPSEVLGGSIYVYDLGGL